MTEDKRPEFRKAETNKPDVPKRELTPRCKRMTAWYEAKRSVALCFFLTGIYAFYVYGSLGLIGQWYIAIPAIVFMSFGPLAPPDREYVK